MLLAASRVLRWPPDGSTTPRDDTTAVIHNGTSTLHRIWKLALLIPLTFCTANALAQNDLHSIVTRVDAHYNGMRTLRAEFTETYAGAGITRSESGTLWLKRPGRMRWEYRQPREKLFVTDGKTAWFYVPGEKQARKLPARKLEDLRSPLAYLLGHTKLEKEFSGLSVATDEEPVSAGNIVLRGIPRHLGGITEVLMEIAPDGQFARIRVDQEDGSTTRFQFTNQTENVAVSEQRFRFSPPPGVETIEAEQLGE